MAVALPVIAVALSAIGTGVAVYSSVAAGQQAEQQADQAKKAGEYNAKIAEANAEAAQQQARYEAERIRKRAAVIAGKQKAAAGKSGVLISDIQDVMLDTGTENELDALVALYGGQVEATNYMSRADISRMEGGNLASAYESKAFGSYMQAGSTILTGTGNTMSKYADYQAVKNNPKFN